MGYNSYRIDSEQNEQSLFLQRSEAEAFIHEKEGNSDDRNDEERIQNIMLFLIERIRPMIEQLSSVPSSDATTTAYEQYMYHDLIQQCDRMKVLPLGPSILRCIGRAYRYEGQRIARHLKSQIPKWKNSNILHNKVPSSEPNYQYHHHQHQHEQQQHIVDRKSVV